MVQPKGKGYWADPVPTPLGLIKETDGSYTLFYTGILKSGKGGSFRGEYSSGVGFVILKVVYGTGR